VGLISNGQSALFVIVLIIFLRQYAYTYGHFSIFAAVYGGIRYLLFDASLTNEQNKLRILWQETEPLP
jgi:hypothetical protein